VRQAWGEIIDRISDHHSIRRAG